MHAIVAEIVSGTVTKIVEVVVERAFRAASEPRAPAAPPPDPVDQAVGVIHCFLDALARRDLDALTPLCDIEWAMRPETAELMDHTLVAAPPVSWAFKELHAPEEWVAGRPLPWLIAELAVTFDLGGRYEVISAVLRTVLTRYGWQLDYLWWGAAAEPEPEPEVFADFNQLLSSLGQEAFVIPEAAVPEHAVIECARCGQKLRVPTSKGRLRVTCRRCSNVQWYAP